MQILNIFIQMILSKETYKNTKYKDTSYRGRYKYKCKEVFSKDPYWR